MLALSEDPNKVLGAMKKILVDDTASLERNNQMIRLVSEEFTSLDLLRNQLRDRHIRAAARRLFLSELRGSSTSLMLNRQAATVGIVALCSSADQSPLGPIHVILDSKQIEAVIDWLTTYESG